MPNDPIDKPATIPWPPILLASAILFAILLGRAAPLPWPGLDDTPARLIGLGFGLAGILLMIWSAITLRRHRTTILPNAGAEALVTSGPFRYRRNPIYLADVLLLLGAAELSKNLWFAILALVFALLVTWLAIIPEEQHLEARFGDDYRAYKDRTRRWI